METIEADIAVIGAGAVGASCAYQSRLRGLNVVLADARMPTAGTSGACSGLIAISTKKPGLSMEMAAETKRLYPEVIKSFDRSVEYRSHGCMQIIEWDEILPLVEHLPAAVKAAGYRMDLLDRDEALRREPQLAPNIVGALDCPGEASVNPYLMTIATVAAAENAGAKTHWHARAVAAEVTNGHLKAVITGRSRIVAEQFVFCGGVWSPDLGRLVGLDLPVVPRRGEVAITARCNGLIGGYMTSASSMVVKNRPELMETAEDPLMRAGGGFAAHANAIGQIQIGTTRSFGGYDRIGQPDGIYNIVAAAAQRLPVLGQVPILRTFVGLRPHVRDGKPIIGRSGRIDNLLVATGHDGDGISLSVVTGVLITELATGRAPRIDISPLTPDRFPPLEPTGAVAGHA